MSEQERDTVADASAPFVEEIEKSFEVGDLNTAWVSISNVTGSIDVAAAEQSNVTIRAVKRSRSRRAFERTRVEFAQDGNQISARTQVDDDVFYKGVLDFLKSGQSVAEVHYTVRLPASCAALAKTVNGSVHITGLTRQTEANAVNGSVHIQNASGRVDAASVNGSLHVESIAGDAELSTVNGSLHLRDAQLKTLDARTVSGNLRAQLSIDPEGNYQFSSTNGNCELFIPADSRCTVRMQAVNGGVQFDLPNRTTVSEMRPAFSRWEGEVNGGGAPVTFKTVNGRLRVGSTDMAAAAALEAAQAEANGGEQKAAQTKLDLLKAIERGELSVEDAMKQMKRNS